MAAELAKPGVLLLLTFLVSLPIAAQAQMVRVAEAIALDGVVACLRTRNLIITTTRGPCADYTPPRQIRIGEKFLANGEPKIIRVIVATKVDEDMPELGIEAGEWTCSAAESLKDMPLTDKSDSSGTWLFIAHCQPTN